MIQTVKPLILASASKIRAKMLHDLGISFELKPSSFDEEAHKPLIKGLPFPHQALALAQEKAKAVSQESQESWVIGADQMCVLEENVLLNKPGTHENAMAQLQKMAGKTHRQYCATVLFHQGKMVFSSLKTATLRLRALKKKHIELYLLHDKPYQAAGSYHLESKGKLLFESIEGEEETIMGLALTPLLNALFSHQILSWKEGK